MNVLGESVPGVFQCRVRIQHFGHSLCPRLWGAPSKPVLCAQGLPLVRWTSQLGSGDLGALVCEFQLLIFRNIFQRNFFHCRPVLDLQKNYNVQSFIHTASFPPLPTSHISTAHLLQLMKQYWYITIEVHTSFDFVSCCVNVLFVFQDPIQDTTLYLPVISP